MPWQRWEATGRAGAVDGEALFIRGLSVEQLCDAIRSRAAVDVDPPPSSVALYQRDQMGLQGYRHLLAVGALDGLVEASRQSRVCAGAANEVACTVFKVLQEEYGVGKLGHKHSTFYNSMMAQLGLDTRPEAYYDLVPWQRGREGFKVTLADGMPSFRPPRAHFGWPAPTTTSC
ncbi:hypothetical protein TSOC_012328 [Tetrabaena socialis]|uniref:Uncharacterized protein n=1 Tax=Tetrabaena socialis TaxID=47790 RepID=A0A2J7ZNA4_9CHLO|nr:hypothetical protein TSOC_012328 [Tetrabaena socialis]|eukprot:PNH01752.1 hypothetical protein TSOC_012328 [Tetrabaena socialis]